MKNKYLVKVEKDLQEKLKNVSNVHHIILKDVDKTPAHACVYFRKEIIELLYLIETKKMLLLCPNSKNKETKK